MCTEEKKTQIIRFLECVKKIEKCTHEMRDLVHDLPINSKEYLQIAQNRDMLVDGIEGIKHALEYTLRQEKLLDYNSSLHGEISGDD